MFEFAPTRMHPNHATFYRKAGCFRVGFVLYNARSIEKSVGTHLWDAMIRKPLKLTKKCIVFSEEIDIFYVSFTFNFAGATVSIPFFPTINGIFPSVQIRRIQRAARRFLQRKYTQRALPVSMALHSRLGVGSCLADAPVDLIRIIIKFSMTR